METLGGWHLESEKTIPKLAHHLASHTGATREETSRHIFQRLSILLTKGNAALILSRSPDTVEAVVDGDLDH